MRRGRLALALLGACGSLGADPFAEPPIAGGVAPWRDLGPVQVCLGAVRLGETDAGACVPETAPAPAACVKDADCASRQRCLCGHCAARPCAGDDGCGADMACDGADRRCARPCAGDPDCPPAEYCEAGACRLYCERDADCQRGEVCSPRLRRCVVAACGSDADCLPSERCAAQVAARPLAAPAALSRDGRVELYLESDGAILRATGDDPLRLFVDPPDPVAEGAAPAALALPDGRVRLYLVRDGAILAADSDDGVRFGAFAPALRAERPWEHGRVGAPAAAMAGGEVVLAYAGDDGAGVGLARGAPDAALAREREPLLAPGQVADPLLWRGVDRVGDPWLLPFDTLDGPALRVYFSARGVESSAQVEFGRRRPVPANFSIGAAALAGAALHVYPFNPVFDRVIEFLNHGEETSPSVVSHRGRLLLYYASGPPGRPAAGPLRLAEHPVVPR